ncbi:hypothetical protein HNR65_002310 [Desulfosalsimonas propionicica]|uniref:Yip1 domain-containing protein n=1 Tax=Desulfosalsimonas propionicica TaxID=332175 RepID=A0A7W0HLH3_9BACT|nr:hypothetical protein [Desulfosalsimonas propionicica]MBA2881976.1 hypothetical protein [Desulfosalsimonas propionicica]
MNYPSAMQAVLRLDESAYPAIMAENRTVWYCVVNISVFGILHALFSLYFSSSMMAGSPAAEPLPPASRVTIILVGVAVAFFMHAGAAMFLWVFSRGVGGNTSFFPVYFNLGISFIGLWPLAPVLAAIQSGINGTAVLLLLFLASIYALAVILLGTKNASGLSMIRMSTAMAITIVFVGCFLYLWL